MISLRFLPWHPTALLSAFQADSRNWGLPIGLGILAVWAVSLIALVSWDLHAVSPVWIGLGMVWQMFLYTGLFITAHDAMHGVAFPCNRRVNDFLGAIAVGLYALFDFPSLRHKHWQHHHHPASALDPDFHDGQHRNFIAWYLHFMQTHWSWWRILGLMAIFNVVIRVLPVSSDNLTLFWAIPSLVSSVQLFYFGTYLPHREPVGGYRNLHCAETIHRPLLWSFLTCYHFGYHEEHHELPQVPWWQLPAVHQRHRQASSGSPS